MPTRNSLGRSRRLHNGWPVPAEAGCVYTLHFARPLGSAAQYAQHYTGFTTDLAARLAAHWAGGCDVRLVRAFRKAGIPFVVVSIEHGVTRARENQLKLASAARRCPVCRGPAMLTESGPTADTGVDR